MGFLLALLSSYDGDDFRFFGLADSVAISRICNGLDCRTGLLFRNFQSKCDVRGKGTVCDAHGIRWDQTFYDAHKGIGEGNVYDLIREIVGNFRCFQTEGYTMAISPYEAAGTELDAAEIAGDDNNGVGDAVFFSTSSIGRPAVPDGSPSSLDFWMAPSGPI